MDHDNLYLIFFQVENFNDKNFHKFVMGVRQRSYGLSLTFSLSICDTNLLKKIFEFDNLIHYEARFTSLSPWRISEMKFEFDCTLEGKIQ